MAKKKYYVVKRGRVPGIYFNWDDAKAQVDGFEKPVYKGFFNLSEVAEYLGEKIETSKEDSETESVEKCSDEDCAIAYVDGSYNNATGKYSGAAVFFYNGEEKHLKKLGEDEELASMRNVAGEIMASMMAMKEALDVGAKSLTIYHDYEGIAAWCEGKWKTNKEGTIAYKQYYDSISSDLDVKFVKVAGHSGDKYNDLADELAKSLIF